MFVETIPWLGDVLRAILVVLALVLGTALIWRQRGLSKIEADAKKTAADAELQKQLNEKAKLENPQPGAAATGAGATTDVGSVLSELVKGLSSSAPLLAGGIALYILAGVLLGALTFSASAAVGESGAGTSQVEEK